MNKQFPLGIIASLVAIALIAVGGGYLLYRVIDGASPLKAEAAHAASTPPPAREQGSGAAPVELDGYLVFHLRASVELSPDTGTAAFDTAIESKGFSQACPGKVVSTDHRVQRSDFWSEEEGAIAEAKSIICVPAPAIAADAAFKSDASSLRMSLDDDDVAVHPTVEFKGQGQAAFVKTGKVGFMLYAGALSAKTCDSGCEAGASAGVSVTRVSRPMADERFIYAVPTGDSKTLNVTATVAATQ